MRTTHTGELADEVRAAKTLLQDVVDDPKSSAVERQQAEDLLRLSPGELADRIEVSQRERDHVSD